MSLANDRFRAPCGRARRPEATCENGRVPDSPTGHTIRLRPSRTALLVVLFLLFCVTPLAFEATPLLVLYALPLGVLLWIIRSGTDIDADGVRIRAVLGSRRLRWEEIQALSPTPRGELRAVLRDGSLMRLPQVRLRHLELISSVSGGAVPTPDTPTAERDESASGHRAKE